VGAGIGRGAGVAAKARFATKSPALRMLAMRVRRVIIPPSCRLKGMKR
jgi:hypothetical protein